VGAAAVVAFVLLRDGDPPRPDRPTASASATPTTGTARPSPTGFVPTRVDIPSIGVDAPVVGLGTGADGAQEVPEALDVTGWWRDGARVGGPGSTAIVGHTSSSGGGVLDRLDDLEQGAEITVAGRGAADRARYVVRTVRTLPVEDFRRIAAGVYATRGPSRLVVMTCGDFDGEEFRSTVVAIATPRRS
jgi:LPXTG-site transpeptidase (sortase) family protein